MGMPYFMHGNRIIGHMAAFKPHGALGFWHGSGREAAERGESDDAIGRLGRSTSAKNLPPKRELLRIVKPAVALGAKPAATPRCHGPAPGGDEPPVQPRGGWRRSSGAGCAS